MKVLETKPDFLFTEWCVRKEKTCALEDAYKDFRFDILLSITSYTGVSISEMKSPSHARKFVYARILLYYFTDVYHTARVLGKNRTTIIHYRYIIETEKLYGFDLDVKEITKLILE